MSELELRLNALRDEIAWPETPSLEPTFEPRAARGSRVRRSHSASRSCWPCLPACSRSRRAPAALSSRSSASAARPSSAWRRSPIVPAQRVDFGERVSRDEAERRTGFRLLDLGTEPDAIFIRPDGLASAVYGDPARPRLVLSQARGAIYEGFIKKTGRAAIRPFSTSPWAVSPASSSTGPTISSCSGTSTAGSRTNSPISPARCCSGTAGPLLLRLEGDLTRDQALELAESAEVGNRCGVTGVSPS